MDVSMSYEHVNLLLILLGITAIIHFLVLRKIERRMLYFSNYVLLERIMGRKMFHKNYPVLILRMFIVILLVLAISDFKLVVTQDSASFDYVLAIDTSPSMSMNFNELTDLTIGFLDKLPKETKVGLVTFSKESYVKSGLTQDYDLLKKDIVNLTVGMPPGTSIGKALLTSSNILDESRKANKTIILITDGNIEEMMAIDINNSLDTLKNKNISVFALGINNTEYGQDYEIPDRLKDAAKESNDSVSVYMPRLDAETLMLIANQTRGAYYEINGEVALDNAFNNIILSQKQDINLDARTYVLGIIGLLLFVEWGLGATKFKTIP